MKKSKIYESKIQSRNRESLRVSNKNIALIQASSRKCVVYLCACVSTSVSAIKKRLKSEKFSVLDVKENPAHIKNPKDIYFAKIDLTSDTDLDALRTLFATMYTEALENASKKRQKNTRTKDKTTEASNTTEASDTTTEASENVSENLEVV